MHFRSHPSDDKRAAMLPGIALTLIILVVTPVLYIAYRLTPVYLDYYFMVTTAQHLVQVGEANRMSDSQIRNDFAATMRLNHVGTFQPGSLSVERLSGKTVLVIDYHVDVELLPGKALTLRFQEEVP